MNTYTLNKSIFNFATIIFVCLSACQSHEQKANDAFDNVKESKLHEVDNQPHANVSTIIETPVKTVIISDWDKYKIEIETRIVANEIKIRKLKSQEGVEAKLFKKISAVEKENTLLRLQMNEFNSETNNRLLKFKSDMNDQIQSIELEIKAAQPETLAK